MGTCTCENTEVMWKNNKTINSGSLLFKPKAKKSIKAVDSDSDSGYSSSEDEWIAAKPSEDEWIAAKRQMFTAKRKSFSNLSDSD